jgi:putative membrane protein
MMVLRVAVRLSLLSCFAVVPVAGLAQKHTPAAQKHTPARRPPLDAREQAFVAQATSDDAMQITLAKLAMAKSDNPKVRELASRIVSDHTALNLQFAKLAANTSSKGRAHGVPVGEISAMTAHLQGLRGDAFDQAFAGMMVKEHRKIMAAYEVAAKSSADDRLRTIAARGVPVLQGHLDAARALMKQGSPAEIRREEK